MDSILQWQLESVSTRMPTPDPHYSNHTAASSGPSRLPSQATDAVQHQGAAFNILIFKTLWPD